ncbi:MAG: FAD-dependent oxidoreductase [Heliobacteriaceae bacterium]|jgi:electron transfer flavoprotein-quinone oxidoreductase|nr:FAD-dependent oxidoreductase [Heliobacteriaceae bacterium]
MVETKTDIIVAGGGPAGIAAAVTAARAGRKVILIERGKFSGSKNVFGGAVYAKAVREIFPDFEEKAPLERRSVKHNFALLGKEDFTVISYGSAHSSETETYITERGKFDRWMAQEARKEGVIIVEETVVRELIIEERGGKKNISGVRTELEDYYADIVILADGVNSLLAEQAGLRGKIEPKDVALSIKEVIKLDREKINERFGVKADEGCIYQIFGGPMLGIVGLGFLYTNKNSVSIGLGIALNELISRQVKPYDVLDELKNHPAVAPLIKDGELLEYSAHLIPECGYKKMPKLYADGVMIAGDAGMLVDNVHWEGTNLAMISGKTAGETAVEALNAGDFSAKFLSRYEKSLRETFVIKDLYTYRDVMEVIHKHAGEFLGYYPQKINAFFKMFTGVDGIPKRDKYHAFIKSIFTDRKISKLSKDVAGMVKLIWSIMK